MAVKFFFEGPMAFKLTQSYYSEFGKPSASCDQSACPVPIEGDLDAQLMKGPLSRIGWSLGGVSAVAPSFIRKSLLILFLNKLLPA